MVCPYLDYRDADEDHEFDHDRAYCDVMNEFVLPIRSSICNNEYDWSHETHCEIYQDHEQTA